MFLPGPGEIPFNPTHLKSDMYESDLYETRIIRQVFPVTTENLPGPYEFQVRLKMKNPAFLCLFPVLLHNSNADFFSISLIYVFLSTVYFFTG